MAQKELHEHVTYKGRDICSCGDFNCASLDTLPEINRVMTESPERTAVAKAYSSRRWATKVRKMDDKQVLAVFLRLRNQKII